MKKAKGPEAVLQEQVIDWLKASGVLFWRMPIGPVMRGSGAHKFFVSSPIKGFPDLAGVLAPGRFFVIELKSDRGRLAPEQREWRDDLLKAGVIYVLARDLATVVEALKTGRSNPGPVHPTKRKHS